MREGSHGAFFRGLGASMVGASLLSFLQIPGMEALKARVSLEACDCPGQPALSLNIIDLPDNVGVQGTCVLRSGWNVKFCTASKQSFPRSTYML